jgi:hypothetical protein
MSFLLDTLTYLFQKGDVKEITGQRIKLITEDISKSLVVDMHRVKLFEFFVKFVNQHWPPPPTPINSKTLPKPEMYSYGMQTVLNKMGARPGMGGNFL